MATVGVKGLTVSEWLVQYNIQYTFTGTETRQQFYYDQWSVDKLDAV